MSMEWRNLSSLVICSNSKSVILLASLNLDPPWKIEAIVRDIRQFAAIFGFKFLFIPKSQNVITHRIVRAAIKRALPCNWVSVIPSSIRSLLERMV